MLFLTLASRKLRLGFLSTHPLRLMCTSSKKVAVVRSVSGSFNALNTFRSLVVAVFMMEAKFTKLLAC